jgi:exonuclease SbcC
MSEEDVSTKVLTPSSSLLNTLLTSMVLIGLGVIGGFGIFHFSLHHRYVDRIYRTEQTHNVTLAVIRDRYIEADKELKQCIETDDGRQGELSELRGRLEAQYKSWHSLTETQRSLYGQHQEKVDQLNGLQTQVQRDQQKLEQKDRDLSTIKEEMERNYQIKIEIESELMKMKEVNANQKQDFTTHIEQKDFELSDVMKKSETLYQRKTQLEVEVADMKHSLEKMQTQMEQKDEELSVFRDEEGNLEEKLFNLRTGMLDLLKEKINEIQNLKNQVGELNEEKEVLELKLENWRNGMLDLMRGKMKEVDELKLDLSESQDTIQGLMNDIEGQQIDHAKAEEFMNEKVDEINNRDADDQKDNESTKTIMNEIEALKAELAESQVWINNKIIEIESLKSEQTESLELINEKMNEGKDLESELTRQQELGNRRIMRLESDLTATRETVQTKTMEVEQLNSQLSEFVNEINVLKSDLFQSDMRSTGEIMINHVQQRDSVMCRQLYVKYINTSGPECEH